MPGDAIARAVEDARVQTMTALREALRTADIGVLRKVAVDIVPELFRAGYSGEPGASGARWAHALARPHAALPTFLVRIHSGPFSSDDAAHLRMTMEGAGIAQAALAILHKPPLDAATRHALGTLVPWLLDTDGLAHLMMNANVGVTPRVYEAKFVDAAYFRV
jgi:hypothetical protein